ncbi:MAG: hypothetical protein RL094_657 [Candidatus Parcubacteria bacterium]|jgi:hypothetical protein
MLKHVESIEGDSGSNEVQSHIMLNQMISNMEQNIANEMSRTGRQVTWQFAMGTVMNAIYGELQLMHSDHEIGNAEFESIETDFFPMIKEMQHLQREDVVADEVKTQYIQKVKDIGSRIIATSQAYLDKKIPEDTVNG